MIEIRHRHTNEVLKTVDADTLRGATLTEADLGGANLVGANLVGAYLRGADLGEADLGGADLVGAYLRGADLVGANLVGANLGGANLVGAYLRGADLGGANLGGVRINWQSHDLLAELLRRKAGDDVQKRCLAGIVLISRDWCWKEFLAIEHPEKDWALRVLAEAAAAQPEGSFIPEDLKPYLPVKDMAE